MNHIYLEHVSLTYPIYSTSARSLKKSLLAVGSGGQISAASGNIIVKALDDISLEINSGDKVGLIGANGAGKSSFLKLIAGIYSPQHGKVSIKGSIASLLNLTLGMDEEATGYDNIYMKCLIMGLTRKQIKSIIPDIEAFTELSNYLSMPIRTYSNGMRLRLGFAISTSIHPDILLLDEVIGVGDNAFMAKAEQRLNAMIEKVSILLLASHDNHTIEKFCNKAILFNQGKILAYGSTQEVLHIYYTNNQAVINADNSLSNTKILSAENN